MEKQNVKPRKVKILAMFGRVSL